MSGHVVGGRIEFKVDGEIQLAKGDFTYNFGRPKAEAVVGSDVVHGMKETPGVPFLEGEITDRKTLDVAKLVTMRDVTATIKLANGKYFALYNAWYAADGDVNTGEGNIQVRFEGLWAEEV